MNQLCNRIAVHVCRLACITVLSMLLAACAVRLDDAQWQTPDALSASEEFRPVTISLNGDWQFKPLDLVYDLGIKPPYPKPSRHNLHTISVPANWYRQGHDHSGAAVYRRYIHVDKKLAGRVARLQFSGVDYEAWIWVNGKFAGQHTGYFAPFSIDVRKHLKYGEGNEIAVVVNSPLERPQDWSLRKRLIKGVLSHHDTRPGGAWTDRGQEKNTGGIWNDVELRFTDKLILNSVQVTPRILAEGMAQPALDLNIDVEQHVGRYVDVTAILKPANFSGRPLVSEHRLYLNAGSQYKLTLPPHQARLWWPATLGHPHLYQLTVRLKGSGGLLDQKTVQFGYRTIKRDADTGLWHVNSERLFLKGTNYIATQWLSEMDRADFERDVELMQRANINAVRVHAHITAPEFYAAADAAGLLVWQDFPLQWGYSDDPATLVEARRQAAEMVETFYNHPSIIVWSLHNEPPFDADWMKWKYPDYDPKQNQRFTQQLAAAVAKLDNTRYTHEFSATSEHPWFGWYSGSWLDYAKPTSLSLITEFGAQALPRLSSLKRIFGSGKALWPDTESDWNLWEYHNFQRHETFKNAKVSQGKNIRQFIRNTQRYQSKVTKLAAESYRRQKYNPVGAAFQFMFVEDWPSVNWGVVDYWRHPKPGYHAMALAFQPVLPSVEFTKETYPAGTALSFPLWIVNDLRRPLDELRLLVTLRKGSKTFSRKTFKASVEADSAGQIGAWTTDGLSPGSYRLELSLKQSGRVVGKNSMELTIND